MSARYAARKPPPLPTPKPQRRRERDEQPIPSAPDVFKWRENELVLGLPRADRKAKKGDGNV
jgi:hypothetical protein